LQNFIISQPRFIKQFIQIFFDCFIIYFSYVFSYVHDNESFIGALPQLHFVIILIVIPICIGVFYVFGLYSSLVRYISADSFAKTPLLILTSAIILWFVSLILGSNFGWTHIVTFTLVGSTLGVGGRFAAQYFLRLDKTSNISNVVVYGAGVLGRELLTAIKQGNELVPVGIIDDNSELTGVKICGVSVYHPNDLKKIVSKHNVTTILVAMSEVTQKSQKHLSSFLKLSNVQIKQIPAISDILSGRANITQFRNIKIENLLGRKPVPPIPALMNVNTSGKSIMVTGAGGSIGSEICLQLVETKPNQLILLDISEYGLYEIEAKISKKIKELGLNVDLVAIIANVCDEQNLTKILKKNKTQTVFHAAAYKHVPLLEANMYAALTNNVFGTQSVVKASISSGVSSLTMISSDKAVRPTNVMGASKRFAELICQAYASKQKITNISMVRFGNVLGSSGSVIPLFKKQISNGGPVTVTHRNMTRYFMTIPEASQLVIQASSMARDGEVFLLDMGPPILILDLAKSMIRLSGYQPYLAEEKDENIKLSHEAIEIKFSNLRPGEKLYEELLISENSSRTMHPRIMKAEEVSIPLEEVNKYIKQMDISIEKGNFSDTRKMLRTFPLDYSPN
jgi:FlaA1/EpsC-like NDP-sugar epimerase